MFSIKKEDKNIRTALILIEIIFAVVALIFVFKWGNSTLLGSLEDFNNDDVKYVRSAWNLVENKILSYENVTESTVYIMPGLTFVLSGFVILFGKFNALIAFRVFQVMLQCGSLYLLFLIGRKVFNSRVAIIACLISSLYIVEIYVPNLILMESIFKFLLLLLIYLSICAVETKKLKLYIWAGVVWSLACLFRPPIAAYPSVILFIWIKSKSYNLKEMFKYASIVLGIFCIIMAPWWIRNYNHFNKFIPFTESSGNPFLQGTFVNYDKSEGWGVPYRKGKDAIESNKYELEAGIERLKLYGRKEPLKFLKWYTIGKTWEFWKAPFYWNGREVFIKALVEHNLILITSIVGIISSFKRKKGNLPKLMILSTIILINLVYLPYFTFERYSYPLMSLMVLFSAYTVFNIKKKIMKESRIIRSWF